jgi:hypothetical protein
MQLMKSFKRKPRTLRAKALTDAPMLLPVCPKCNGITKKVRLWRGAWKKEDGGNFFRRVYLEPGQTEMITCECMKCDTKWEQPIEGRNEKSKSKKR